MSAKEKFQRICDYVDSQNILDFLIDYLSESELNELFEKLEEEFNIEYDDFNDFIEDFN